MNNLSNFSISNLFHTNQNTNFVGKLDINTLFHSEETSFQFDSRSLLNRIHEKRNMLQKQYMKIYKKCCETIKNANDGGYYQIRYDIPLYSECVGYNCSDCLLFIQSNLDKQYLDTAIKPPNSIHISWKNLEQNLQK